jgi:hypothetical protein
MGDGPDGMGSQRAGRCDVLMMITNCVSFPFCYKPRWLAGDVNSSEQLSTGMLYLIVQGREE